MSLVKIRAAIETALAAMPGIIPAATITSSSSGNPCIFTTSTAHGLVAGLTVTIANHTQLTGTYFVVPISATTFSLKALLDGSAVGSSASGSGGTVLANLIAWENTAFVPTPRVPYMMVNLMPAQPDNPMLGDGFYREIGIYQIALIYPVQIGSAAIMTRAELIRSTFPRGASFSNSGIVVNIDRTPEIRTPEIFNESYRLAVRIRYRADIFA